MLKICVYIACLGSIGICYKDQDIRNLIGEPDYRKVSLHWEVAHNDLTGSSSTSFASGNSEPAESPRHRATFQVRYCELQTWGAQRCRTKTVLPLTPRTPRFSSGNGIADKTRIPNVAQRSNGVDPYDTRHEDDGPVTIYETDVSGLRMATTYSFEVRPAIKESGTREYRANGGDGKNENMIVIPTKGFSAKATQCLPHASEIEVSTGPHFAGRIAVETTDGERCAIDGQPDSARDTYTLRINHTVCGSQVNSTTVATFVLVQENLPILTHSTRRFLVLCSYQPETLTVRAGLNLPTQRGQAKITMEESKVQQQQLFEENSTTNRKEGRTGRRQGRYLQVPEALVKEQEEATYIDTNIDSINIHSVALIVLLMVVAVTCLIALALKWNLKSIKKMPSNFDDESVVSDVSTTSDLTPADSLDITYMTQQHHSNHTNISSIA